MRKLGIGQFHSRVQHRIPAKWNLTTTISKAKVGEEKQQNIGRAHTTSDSKTETRHPLAIMPTSMLLRSFLTSTVSSNRFLLLLSLSTLLWLSKPGRTWIFNIDKNPGLHGILKKTFYNQFCAGETEEQTRTCVEQLKNLGFRGVILTYAKEIVFDHSTKKSYGIGCSTKDGNEAITSTIKDTDIDAWRDGVLKTLDLVGQGDILALKTTGAGAAVASAFTAGKPPPKQMLFVLQEIATLCKQRGIRIIVDAESQHFQKGIDCMSLDLMREFNTDGYAVIYNTYQAYLKSTQRVVQEHLAATEKDGFTLGLKLVRGAYMYSDDRHLIHNTKQDTDDAYNSIAHGALRQQIGDFGGLEPDARPFPSVNLFLASHNRESVMSAQRLHQERKMINLPTVSVAFGQLHGMSDEVSFSLLQEKGIDRKAPEVYKCTTWGSMRDCVGYLVRRAVENRDAVQRTRDELNAIKKELTRRAGAMFGP